MLSGEGSFGSSKVSSPVLSALPRVPTRRDAGGRPGGATAWRQVLPSNQPRLRIRVVLSGKQPVDRANRAAIWSERNAASYGQKRPSGKATLSGRSVQAGERALLQLLLPRQSNARRLNTVSVFADQARKGWSNLRAVRQTRARPTPPASQPGTRFRSHSAEGRD